MSKFSVRNMQRDDIPSIMKIEEKSFGEYHWSEQSFISEMENKLGNYFVAVDIESQKIVGYCGFWNVLDEGHITTLAVHPDYRQAGIGCLLISHMIQTGYEKEIKWFTLEVRVSNIAALNLYKKYAFENIGVRAKYYQDNNEDAIIMWTENIWSDKFKDNLNKVLAGVKSN